MKKRISLLLAALLTLGSTAVGMAAISFSDINNVPWEGAKTYITKVSDLGLMVGEENGNGTNLFRAKDRVTYCETVQLVYNLMKNEGKAEDSKSRVTKWTTVMEGYKIPEWSYQAISYALEESIISVANLSGFMKSIEVGNDSTREDVAVIFGKALSETYDVEDAPSLSFSDKSTISNSAVPYVGLLSDLKILVGDDDKNFNPKNPINRAEMAVVTVKTYSVLSGEELNLSDSTTGTDGSSSSVKGTINYMTKDKITVDKTSGGSGVYTLAANAVITLNGETSTAAKITTVIENGVKVNVKIDIAGGLATKVVADGAEDTIEGYITSITTDKIGIKRTGGTEKTYYFAYNVVLKYEGETSTVKTISNAIKDGVEIEVTAKYDEDSEITRVVANISASGGKVSGAVKKLTESKITMLLSDDSTSSYTVTDETTVLYEDSELTLSKLVDKFDDGTGLSAVIYLNSQKQVSKIEATLEDNSKGVIVNLTTNYITIKPSSGLEQKVLLDEDVVVKYNNGTTESLKHLIELYEKNKTEVVLTLNKKGSATRIQVDLDEEDYDIISGDVNNVELTKIKVGSKTIEMNSSTNVTIDGKVSSIADMYKRYQNGEVFYGKVSFADNIAKNITLTLESVEGRMIGLLKGKITITTGSTTTTYDVAADGDLTIRIDSSKTDYSFLDLNSNWSLKGYNYDVELSFEDGIVTRIIAESV